MNGTMTLSAPAKVGTQKKVIRLPDTLVKMIDDLNMDVHASRSDFILCAIRDFCSYWLEGVDDIVRNLEKQESSGLSRSSVEETFANVDTFMVSVVDSIIKRMPPMPKTEDEVTTVMIYVPDGLIDKMDYVMGFVPSLKNVAGFARVATFFKITELMEENRSIRRIEEYYSRMKRMDKNAYFRHMEERFDLLTESGEFFLDPDK